MRFRRHAFIFSPLRQELQPCDTLHRLFLGKWGFPSFLLHKPEDGTKEDAVMDVMGAGDKNGERMKLLLFSLRGR